MTSVATCSHSRTRTSDTSVKRGAPDVYRGTGGYRAIRSRNSCVSGSVECTAVAFIPRVSSTL